MKRALFLVVSCAMAAPVVGAPVVDGTRDAAYGPAIAVQSVDTQFGDSTGGITGGGELNAGYAIVDGGRLYVMLTGNIENNFNKMSVFIDSKPGGENVMSNLPQYDTNNVSQNFGGLTFDAGFAADYHVFGRWGGAGNVFSVDIADRAGGGNPSVMVNGAEASAGGGTPVQSGVINPGNNGMDSSGNRTLSGFISQPVEFGFNNNNSGGVGGGTGPANVVAALAVTTGFEFSVALSDIGNPTDVIRIHAVYGNGDNNYHSNQTLAGLPAGTGNLGGDGMGGFTGTLSGVNFNNFAGEQFFTVIVPEPASLTWIGCAIASLALRRRR